MSTGNIPVPTRYVAPGQVYNVIVPQPSATENWFFTPKCHLKILSDQTVIQQDNTGAVLTTYRFLQVKLSCKANKCDRPYIEMQRVNTTTGAILATFRQNVEVVC